MWNVQLCVDIMDSHLSVCVFYALFAVLFHWGEASRCIFWIPFMVLLCTDGIGLLLKLIFILFSLCQSRWHLQIAIFLTITLTMSILFDYFIIICVLLSFRLQLKAKAS